MKKKFQLYSKTKPLLGSKIVSGVEKDVREAMPMQEGEEDSEKPAAKAKPILKRASTRNRNFIPMRERKWIDIEVVVDKRKGFNIV